MRKFFIKPLSFFVILTISFPSLSFAISQPYKPGETLDPSCIPGEVNCFVEQPWTVNNNTNISTNNVSIQKTTKVIGPELITNGAFTSNADGWILGDCATYNNGKIDIHYDPNFYSTNNGCSNSNIKIPVTLVSGHSYALTYTISNSTDLAYFYLNNFNSPNADGNGTFTHVFTAYSSVPNTLSIEQWNWDDNTGFTIDDVSLKEVDQIYNNPSLQILSINGNQVLNIGSTLNSSFIGENAGDGATSASDANFLGYNAGQNATYAADSNFFGQSAGDGATSASDANFLGYNAGQNATYAAYSNFLGQRSGNSATYAQHSNFLGAGSGFNATSASNSNFLGNNAGSRATSAYFSNFLGSYAGFNATSAQYSNFLGAGSGFNATSASNSNFLGSDAGSGATFASNSNFLGSLSGSNATYAQYSNFLGSNAGSGATYASNSNFLGLNAGLNATSANTSNFFGRNAGRNATNASEANFLGIGAGDDATNAFGSNFFGTAAGDGATGAFNANFFGVAAGYNATGAIRSNFFGQDAGNSATNATTSNFFGYKAGQSAINASNSIFIGQSSGYNDSVNNTGNVDDFSILIGKDTNTGGFSNSIAIGGSTINTASNQFMIGSSLRPINTMRINGSSSTQCTITTGTGISCSSDERLKTNIVDLPTDTLEKLTNIRTVSYNWVNTPNSNQQIGFLAHNLETYFPQLVATDSDGYKSVYYSQITPILTEALKEMNLKLIGINNMEKENSYRDILVAWFGNASNKITRVFTGEICLTEVGQEPECINRTDLKNLKSLMTAQALPGNTASDVVNVVPAVENPTTDTIKNEIIGPIVQPIVNEPQIQEVNTVDPTSTSEIITEVNEPSTEILPVIEPVQ